MTHTEITAASLVSSVCRLTIVCNPSMICALTTTGSIPPQGIDPCVPFPCTFIVNQSEAAMAPSDRYLILPTSVEELMCNPKTTSTLGLSNTPSLIISAAPPSSPGGGPSSAG